MILDFSKNVFSEKERKEKKKKIIRLPALFSQLLAAPPNLIRSDDVCSLELLFVAAALSVDDLCSIILFIFTMICKL